MGLSADLAAKSYRQDEAGNFYILPYGAWGAARLFKNERAYEKSREFLTSTYQWMFFCGPVAGVLMRKTLAGGLLLITLMALYWFLVVSSRITRNSLPAVLDAEIKNTDGQSQSTGQLVLMLICGMAFAAGGLAMAASGKPSGYLVALFFGGVSVVAVMQLMRR